MFILVTKTSNGLSTYAGTRQQCQKNAQGFATWRLYDNRKGKEGWCDGSDGAWKVITHWDNTCVHILRDY